MEIEVNKRSEAVVEITLNRPEKRNALSVALLEELSEALEAELSCNRLVILKGNGLIFCAGLDLKEALEIATIDKLGTALCNVLIQLVSAPAITVAAVQGAALAGGAGLMAGCDLCIAETGAQIGFPEAKRGLVPSLITPILDLQVQRRHLNELFYLGDSITAERAYEIGLVNEVTPKGGIDEALDRLVSRTMQVAPNTVMHTKRILDQEGGKPLAEKILSAYKEHTLMKGTDEAKEGVAAFIEKRAPSWVH